MAILKVKEAKELTDPELNKRLSEMRLELAKELGNVRMGRPVKNPGKIKELRRAIARIMSVKTERRKVKKK